MKDYEGIISKPQDRKISDLDEAPSSWSNLEGAMRMFASHLKFDESNPGDILCKKVLHEQIQQLELHTGFQGSHGQEEGHLNQIEWGEFHLILQCLVGCFKMF